MITTHHVTAHSPQYPKGHLVVEMPSQDVIAAYSTAEAAKGYADALDRWLAARPSPDGSWETTDFSLPPSDAALAELIDRIYAPEERLTALAAGFNNPEGSR